MCYTFWAQPSLSDPFKAHHTMSCTYTVNPLIKFLLLHSQIMSYTLKKCVLSKHLFLYLLVFTTGKIYLIEGGQELFEGGAKRIFCGMVGGGASGHLMRGGPRGGQERKYPNLAT